MECPACIEIQEVAEKTLDGMRNNCHDVVALAVGRCSLVGFLPGWFETRVWRVSRLRAVFRLRHCLNVPVTRLRGLRRRGKDGVLVFAALSELPPPSCI